MTMANDLQDRERGKQTGHQSGYPMHVETPVAVSVVVMSYNNARFIGETIESVLSQQDVALELIIVDDCSSDDSLEVVRRY